MDGVAIRNSRRWTRESRDRSNALRHTVSAFGESAAVIFLRARAACTAPVLKTTSLPHQSNAKRVYDSAR
jgi:hypothetical protein